MVLSAAAVVIAAVVLSSGVYRWTRWEASQRDLTFGTGPIGAVFAVATAWLVTVCTFGQIGLWGLVLGVLWGVAAGVDLVTMRIPDRTSVPAALAAVGVTVTHGSVTSLLAGAGVAVFLAVVWFVYPKGLGFGDVKLAWSLYPTAGVVSAALTLLGFLAGTLLGMVVGVVALAVTRRRSPFPFGPALIIGNALVVAAGPGLADWYLRLGG